MAATGHHKAGRGISLLTTKQRQAMQPARPASSSSWWLGLGKNRETFDRRATEEFPRMRARLESRVYTLHPVDERRPKTPRPNALERDDDG